MNLQERYLDLVKKSLLDNLNQDVATAVVNPGSLDDFYRPEWREHYILGRAVSMCGSEKLDHLQSCVETCLREDIAGDFIECGVWRGGTAILMCAVLAAFNDENRTVWAADSYAGFPQLEPDSVDKTVYKIEVEKFDKIAVDLDTVKGHFHRYGLLTDRVKFLKGWFSDTLPDAPIEELAILRLDGDLYSSTMDIFHALYDNVVPGGFIILDEYGVDGLWGEHQAVHEFREQRGIKDEIIKVNWECAYWRKSA